MKIIRIVSGVYGIGDGERVLLSPAQIKPRERMLSVIGEGQGLLLCAAARPLQFKAGELLGVDSVPKAFAERIEELSEEAAAEAIAADAKQEEDRKAAEASAKAAAKRKADAAKKAAGKS